MVHSPPRREEPNVPDALSQPPRIFRLAAVTGRIRDLLLEVSAKRFWVRAQLVARSAARSGHFYGELLEDGVRTLDASVEHMLRMGTLPPSAATLNGTSSVVSTLCPFSGPCGRC